MRGFIASAATAHMLDVIAREEEEQRRKKNEIAIILTQLTPREREVAGLLAKGLPYVQIGKRLDISPHTVHFHVSNLLFKVGTERQTGIVAFAIKAGLA